MDQFAQESPRRTNDLAANFSFHAWVRDNLQAGTPYDQMVKELLGATGTIASNPAVAWYKRVKDPKEQLEDISQLFLGVRLQCANAITIRLSVGVKTITTR